MMPTSKSRGSATASSWTATYGAATRADVAFGSGIDAVPTAFSIAVDIAFDAPFTLDGIRNTSVEPGPAPFEPLYCASIEHANAARRPGGG